jgi:uncharacterized protein (TIGR02246 family)
VISTQPQVVRVDAGFSQGELSGHHEVSRSLRPVARGLRAMAICSGAMLFARKERHPVPSDEQQIRDLVSTWMSATQAGDVQTVLSLMTDDVVFLRPGQPPMRKPEFAAAAQAQAQAAGQAPRFQGRSEIQEIQLAGDWAFVWAKLQVTATPPDGSSPTERAGHTLTVFHKQDGGWRLARDANLLAPVNKP